MTAKQSILIGLGRAGEREVAQETKQTERTKKVAKPSTKKVVTTTDKKQRKWTKPFRAVGGYFIGAWQELKQVHWPNRKQTWALTLAVMLFSFGLGLIIFLLDLLFTYLFKEVIL